MYGKQFSVLFFSNSLRLSPPPMPQFQTLMNITLIFVCRKWGRSSDTLESKECQGQWNPHGVSKWNLLCIKIINAIMLKGRLCKGKQLCLSKGSSRWRCVESMRQHHTLASVALNDCRYSLRDYQQSPRPALIYIQGTQLGCISLPSLQLGIERRQQTSKIHEPLKSQ